MADETNPEEAKPPRGITNKDLDAFEDHYRPIEEETGGRAEGLGAQAATVLILVEILRQGRGIKPPPDPKPDNELPKPEKPKPDNTLPGDQPEIDNDLPGGRPSRPSHELPEGPEPKILKKK